MIKSTNFQIGISNTATQNFSFSTNNDGTVKLARGNIGETTQDVFTVNAGGVVNVTQGLTIEGTSGQRMMLMAAKATTAGTAVDFSPADGAGIPSWAKKVTVQFVGVSTNGTSLVQIQLGAGAVQSSGYSGALGGVAAASSGVPVAGATASDTRTGHIVFTNQSGNSWVASGVTWSASTTVIQSAASVALSGTLDRIRLTTVNGTDTFDAGSVSLLIEG